MARVTTPTPALASSDGSTPPLRFMVPEMVVPLMELLLSVTVPVGGRTGTGERVVVHWPVALLRCVVVPLVSVNRAGKAVG